MQSEHKSVPAPFDRWTSMAGMLAIACQGLSVTVEVFVRSGFGGAYLRYRAVAGLAAIMYFGVLASAPELFGLLVFLVLYLLMLILRKVECARRARTSLTGDRHYGGFPILMRWWPLRHLKEERFKRDVEPLLVLFCGLLLTQVSEGLGQYVGLASVGMVVTAGLEQIQQSRSAPAAGASPSEPDDAEERFRRGFE